MIDDFPSPLNCGISPVALLGRPLWQASLVSATVTPQLPNRNPICWLPASYWLIQKTMKKIKLMLLLFKYLITTVNAELYVCKRLLLKHRIEQNSPLMLLHVYSELAVTLVNMQRWFRSDSCCTAAALLQQPKREFYGKSCSTNAGGGKGFKRGYRHAAKGISAKQVIIV